jgi:transketolase
MKELIVNISSSNLKAESIRSGFGRGLLEAGRRDQNVVAVTADLMGSTDIGDFAKDYPERFIEVGVAEQNLVTVGSGLAAQGKIPFVSSYAAFSPGRNWEQIRTTICLNDRAVKIIGSHAGISVGPDGATHQMLEDIALMRSLPNMVVLAPCDSIEAEKITLAMAKDQRPNYMRLAREATPLITLPDIPFEIGKAYIFREGFDVTLIATGTMTYHALLAAERLARHHISAEVINAPTIKPLDAEVIIDSAKKTRAVVTVEEAQINGGLGGAVAEVLSERCPTIMRRIGMKDHFGESGQPEELLKHFGLDAEHIYLAAQELIDRKG